MKIEITIPVLNEDATIDKKIRELDDYIDSNLTVLGDIKIIIADNGSTDTTSVKAKLLEIELARVEYIKLDEKGVGLALSSSWLKSTADIIGYMDLDLATNLKHIQPALEVLISSNAEIVSGSRLKKGAIVIGRSRIRNFTSMMFNQIIRVVFNTSFSDGMCGFKFLQRRILYNLICNGAKSKGWFFATEILVIAESLKYRIYDLPVMWTDDPNSKVKIINLTIEYLKHIIRLKFLLLKKRLHLK